MGLLSWAFVSLIVSVIAGALGFTGVAADAAALAKFFFGLFLIIAVILFALVMFGVGAAAVGGAAAAAAAGAPH